MTTRLSGKTIFVTGGAGFIGSAVVRHLLEETEAFVVNIDKLTYAANLTSTSQVLGHSRYAFARVDICDAPTLRKLFSTYHPDAVINLAAESHVDRSIDRPCAFINTNIFGTFTLLQEALLYCQSLTPGQYAAFRFLHVSTDEVFGTMGSEGLFTRVQPLCAELAICGKQGIL